MDAEPIIRDPNEANVWMQTVLASIQGCAGALTDDAARRACLLADTVLEGFRERCMRGKETPGILIPRPTVPRDMKAGHG